VAEEVLTWLYETVYERAKGFREYTWQVEMVIPAGSKVNVALMPNPDEVWIEYGYRFDVDEFNVIRFTHYHDGREMYRDLFIGEKEVDLPYTKPEVTENECVVYVENTDTLSDHKVRLTAKYRIIPRKMYAELYQKAVGR
jgi:hypothetical protein